MGGSKKPPGWMTYSYFPVHRMDNYSYPPIIIGYIMQMQSWWK